MGSCLRPSEADRSTNDFNALKSVENLESSDKYNQTNFALKQAGKPARGFVIKSALLPPTE